MPQIPLHRPPPFARAQISAGEMEKLEFSADALRDSHDAFVCKREIDRDVAAAIAWRRERSVSEFARFIRKPRTFICAPARL